jgi:hypothetical protein
MSSADPREESAMRAIVLLKSFREQNKQLFAKAFFRAIRSAADNWLYGDGFVEWGSGMKGEVDRWEELLLGEDDN